jgi:ribosomal protein L35
MATKTNKSYSKRIRVTKNGKLLTRAKGQNHFNSKKSGQERIQDKNMQELNIKPTARARFIPHA